MKLKSLSMLTAIAISTAAPIGIRVKAGTDGEDSFCRVTFNDAGAMACYCTQRELADDCTEPNWIYVCNAEKQAPMTSSGERTEDAAWSLIDSNS